MNVQKIKIEGEAIDKAYKYYSLLSILLSLKLNKKQIQLLAFTAIRGTITPPSAKQDFISKFGTGDSVSNLKSQLTKKGLLVKTDGQHRVNPLMTTDFNSPIILQITMNGSKGQAVTEGK